MAYGIDIFITEEELEIIGVALKNASEGYLEETEMFLAASKDSHILTKSQRQDAMAMAAKCFFAANTTMKASKAILGDYWEEA